MNNAYKQEISSEAVYDLADGIEESLREHSSDLSLLLNRVKNDYRSIGYRITCCQHDTYCCNEILVKNRSTTTMTKENEPELLKDIIESDQAVEPDAKVAEELRMLPENKEGIKKEEIVTAYATVRVPLLKYIMSKKRQRPQREKIILINISRQLDKQAAEIERMSLVLQSIQKYIKPLRRQQPELIKELQSQIKEIQKQTTQLRKYVIKMKRRM